MARREHNSEYTVRRRPVACSLTSADLAAQATRWERLAGRAMTERTETADGLRICFRPDPGVEEELRALVAVENDCCRWAAWAVETAGHDVVLEIRSQREGVAVLHSMFADFGLARPAHRADQISSSGRTRPAHPG
jgi:hypothetical protein